MLEVAGHNDDFVEILVRSGLDKQRRLHNRDALRIALLDLRHPAILTLHHLGMHDGVQLFDAPGKNQVRQLAPIDGAIFIQDFAAEAANNFVIGAGSRCVKLMRQSVSLKKMRTTFHQHCSNGGLATRDATS